MDGAEAEAVDAGEGRVTPAVALARVYPPVPAAPGTQKSTQKSIIFQDPCMCILTLKIAGTQLSRTQQHKASEEPSMRLSKGPKERHERGKDARGRHVRERLRGLSARDPMRLSVCKQYASIRRATKSLASAFVRIVL